MRNILKSDAGMEKVIEIRRKILFGKSKVTAVISPISLLELMEWNAEAASKDFAARRRNKRKRNVSVPVNRQR